MTHHYRGCRTFAGFAIVRIPARWRNFISVTTKKCNPGRRNYFVTTNCGLLLSAPDGVTTETTPVLAPAGTVALM